MSPTLIEDREAGNADEKTPLIYHVRSACCNAYCAYHNWGFPWLISETHRAGRNSEA